MVGTQFTMLLCPKSLYVLHVAQVAGVNTPSAEHEATPEETNPVSQVGWQVAPKAKEAVQSPTPPLVGAAEASHVGVGGEAQMQNAVADIQFAVVPAIPSCIDVSHPGAYEG